MRRYFEFSLVVVLIGLLAMQLTRMLDDMGDTSEEAAVQMEVASMRAQLLEKVAHREAFGGNLPQSDNPVAWLDSPPARGYLGEFDQPPSTRSAWYFDRGEHLLVYRFRDGHVARFRLSRQAGRTDSPGVLAGVGLQRLNDERE